MSKRPGLPLLLLIALAGCRSPVLWVGTARSEAAVGTFITDAGTSKPGPDGAAPPQHTAAEPPSQAHDAGTPEDIVAAPAPQPTAAGTAAPMSGRNAPAPTQAIDPDADAGRSLDPIAPPAPTRLPQITGECPNLTGPGTYAFRAGGRSLSAQLYMLPKAARNAGSPGPLILYFHALGTNAGEVVTALTQKAIDAVVNQGGVVVAFSSQPCLRCGIDDLVWYDEDDVVSDQAVACIRAQATIDPRHIHVAGFSAGALHTLHLSMARSDYIASVLSYSGGTPASVPESQDPKNKVPALLAFGAPGLDNAVADFNVASHAWYDTYKPKGYYFMLCNHGGGHEIPTQLPAFALRFFLDHPYRVSPEPYSDAPPREYPKYCDNGP